MSLAGFWFLDLSIFLFREKVCWSLGLEYVRSSENRESSLLRLLRSSADGGTRAEAEAMRSTPLLRNPYFRPSSNAAVDDAYAAYAAYAARVFGLL